MPDNQVLDLDNGLLLRTLYSIAPKRKKIVGAIPAGKLPEDSEHVL